MELTADAVSAGAKKLRGARVVLLVTDMLQGCMNGLDQVHDGGLPCNETWNDTVKGE